MSRRRVAIGAVVAVLVVLFGGRWLALRFTEVAWHGELGDADRYLHLLWRSLAWRAAAFTAAFAWYGVNLHAVYRSIGSVQVPHRLGNIEISEAVPPRALRLLVLTTAVALALATAWTFGDLDHYVALSRHAVPFGLVEPVLGKDASFYLADLPLLEVVHLYVSLALTFGFVLVQPTEVSTSGIS